jgi:PKD repeat protein
LRRHLFFRKIFNKTKLENLKMNIKNILASLMMLVILVAPVSAATTPLAASFIADPTHGNAPLVVLFKDTSTGSPSVYRWAFGDGGTSTNQNPAHTYLNPGDYTVTLTIYRGSSSSTATQVINVPGRDSASAHPRAHFTATPLSGTSPLVVQFTDKSTGSPTAWLWTFGDGTYSRVQNPTHTYAKAGVYTVRLQVWNSIGACSEQFVDYITVN